MNTSLYYVQLKIIKVLQTIEIIFCFVVSTENSNNSFFFNEEVRTQFRGSCIDVDVNSKLKKRCAIPVYLVVFEMNNEN